MLEGSPHTRRIRSCSIVKPVPSTARSPSSPVPGVASAARSPRLSPPTERAWSSSTASPKDYAWCDVLVVGGGLAGLAAAQAAGTAGARVLLVEEQPRLGGSLVWHYGRDLELQKMGAGLVEALVGMNNVEVRCGSIAGGHYADGWVAVFDDERMTNLSKQPLWWGKRYGRQDLLQILQKG